MSENIPVSRSVTELSIHRNKSQEVSENTCPVNPETVTIKQESLPRNYFKERIIKEFEQESWCNLGSVPEFKRFFPEINKRSKIYTFLNNKNYISGKIVSFSKVSEPFNGLVEFSGTIGNDYIFLIEANFDNAQLSGNTNEFIYLNTGEIYVPFELREKSYSNNNLDINLLITGDYLCLHYNDNLCQKVNFSKRVTDINDILDSYPDLNINSSWPKKIASVQKLPSTIALLS